MYPVSALIDRKWKIEKFPNKTLGSDEFHYDSAINFLLNRISEIFYFNSQQG